MNSPDIHLESALWTASEAVLKMQVNQVYSTLFICFTLALTQMAHAASCLLCFVAQQTSREDV